jgi:hypothetical protein
MHSSHKRKFSPGAVIGTVAELLLAREQGRWIYFGSYAQKMYGRPRVYHPVWICNMQFGMVCGYIKAGVLRLAVRDADFPYIFKASSMSSDVPEKSSEWWVTCSELPMVTIRAFTKDAVIAEAEDAVRKHVGPHKFVIKWDAPETYAGIAKELPALLK